VIPTNGFESRLPLQEIDSASRSKIPLVRRNSIGNSESQNYARSKLRLQWAPLHRAGTTGTTTNTGHANRCRVPVS
jgi:hypothetical protein